jgi:3-(3-hydroxy-phenyl)propionate hydroxylase
MNIEWATYFDYPRHALHLPALRDGVDVERRKVVIVGAGPIGMALALGLANYGVPSLLLEADDTVCIGSRATCYSRRTLEIFEKIGAVEPIIAKGLAWTGGRSYHRDSEVFQLRMPHDENQKYPPMLNMQQCWVEKYLLDAVHARRDLIEVRWLSKVSGAQVRDDGARVHVSTERGDYAIETDWVVACDGARSAIRQALGLKFHGTQYEGRYVIVDIQLKSDYPTERRAWFDPPSNPGSTLLMHKQPDNIWRLDYQLRDDEDPDEAVKPENVIPRVASHLKMIGERDDWKPVWISMYKANALTLERYRHGRALFAGDAAHLVPIFGVRGLNSGIDDTHNLAWKLAFVVNGWASDALLDTYSDERVFAARENLRHATKSTEFMAPPSHAFSLMREAVLSLAPKHAFVRSLINPRQTTAIDLAESALNVFSERSAQFASGPRPGEVAPECPLTIDAGGAARAGFVGDLCGAHLSALYFSEDGDMPDALVRALDSPALPLRASVIARRLPAHAHAAHDHTGRCFALYGAQAGTLYLLRPDGHIMARWRDAAGKAAAREIEQALQRVRQTKASA